MQLKRLEMNMNATYTQHINNNEDIMNLMMDFHVGAKII